MEGTRLMQGNEAVAEGAIAAGITFFAGYPITPSTEIAEQMAKLLPKIGGTFLQMEDEIGAMGAILGASLAGAKVMDATSGPGFSLKQELIGYAACAEIPCVVANVQRVGPSTGQPTAPSQGDVMQARWGTHGDHPIIALSPWSVRESFDMAVMAVNYAERFRTPVILLTDEIIGHLRENVTLPSLRKSKSTRAACRKQRVPRAISPMPWARISYPTRRVSATDITSTSRDCSTMRRVFPQAVLP